MYTTRPNPLSRGIHHANDFGYLLIIYCFIHHSSSRLRPPRIPWGPQRNERQGGYRILQAGEHLAGPSATPQARHRGLANLYRREAFGQLGPHHIQVSPRTLQINIDGGNDSTPGLKWLHFDSLLRRFINCHLWITKVLLVKSLTFLRKLEES